jgi:hypothetical protein
LRSQSGSIAATRSRNIPHTYSLHSSRFYAVRARPFPFDEELHPTVWTTSQGLRFLDRRDPTRPFFLTLSYVRPHPPLDPPRSYWEQYLDRRIPEPVVGDWVDDR